MDDVLTSTILIVTVASGIRLATPFLLASLGEALGQRSGVLNLGVDGVMLLGAFGGYYTVLNTGNLFFGIWGFLEKFFYGFWVKSGFMGAKTHSGHCGTIENGQKWGEKVSKNERFWSKARHFCAKTARF